MVGSELVKLVEDDPAFEDKRYTSWYEDVYLRCVEAKDDAFEALMSVRALVSEDTLPSDYETCGECGFDHEYEYEAAHKYHSKLEKDSHK